MIYKIKLKCSYEEQNVFDQIKKCCNVGLHSGVTWL